MLKVKKRFTRHKIDKKNQISQIQNDLKIQQTNCLWIIRKKIKQ